MTVPSKVVQGMGIKFEDTLPEQKEDLNRFSKIVPLLLQKGIDKLNLSMFSPELRTDILLALGDEYRKKGDLYDAARAYLLVDHKDKLNLIGEDYEILMQWDNCIEVYKLSDNRSKLVKIGKRCLMDGNLKEASKAFMAADDAESLLAVSEKCVDCYRYDQAFEILSFLQD